MRTRTPIRHSLAFRIIAACVLLGTGLSFSFAVLVFLGTEFMENRLAESMLRDELAGLLESIEPEEAPLLNIELSRLARGHVVPIGGGSQLPGWLSDLRPGIHEVRDPDGLVQQVLVHETPDRRVVITKDFTEFETRQRQLGLLLVAGALLAAYLSLWIGWLLSRQVIVPVVRLSEAVSSFSPEAPVALLQRDFPDDELGRLAAALDSYRLELHAALSRERDFSADVSHELRTPLAVIAGALEVLVDQGCTPRQADRLERIRRAVGEMQYLIELFLLLSRRPEALEKEEHPLAPLAAEVVEAECTAQPQRAVAVKLEIPAEAKVAAPERVVAVVVGNLLRNAIRHAPGEILLRLEGSRLEVYDHGPGFDPAKVEAVAEPGGTGSDGGSGRGLRLVGRLCTHFGWRLQVAGLPGGGTAAVVDFGDSLTGN